MSMDGNQTAINPLAVTELEPAGEVDVQRGPKVMPDSELKLYAAATGKNVIKLQDLSKRAVLGDLVQKLGAARVGSSMLIDSEEMIQEGIKLCDNAIADYAHEPDIVASIMKARLGFVDLWVKAAQAHIKSRKDAGLDEPTQKPQNLPPPPLVPVQINIHGKQVSTESNGK